MKLTRYNFDFVGTQKLWLGVSLAAIVGSFVLLATKGLNYGIDFAGGAEVQVSVEGFGTEEIRKVLEAGGVQGLRVQSLGGESVVSAGRKDFMIRATGDETAVNQIANQVEGILSKEFGRDKFSVLKSDAVGPAAGTLLRRNGLLAVFYSLLAILIYVGFRFDSRYAPATVIPLFHDALISIGVIAALGMQFDLTVLAAILAVIGYSTNDTIIVFDRIRETIFMHPEYSIEQAVNRSINDTLSRTTVTALTTLFVSLTLYLFGGATIEGFAFTLTIGVVVGTYSSIFIASPILIFLTHYQQKRNKKLKASGKHAKA